MKGDFSRDSFDSTRHYSRVLMQQGRLLLDADWNEQASILLHRLETMMKDIIGPHGGAEGRECGFSIACTEFTDARSRDFNVGDGRYYVDGLLCENLRRQKYSDLLGGTASTHQEPCLVYLDVWEHYVNAVEAPHLRESALGGFDTTGRARIIWRLRTHALDEQDAAFKALTDQTLSVASLEETWKGIEERLQGRLGRLQVRTRDPAYTEERGARGEQSRTGYRGPENQLYRVEIHAASDGEPATFKCSRDNGSVVFAVDDEKEGLVTLAGVGRDSRFSLRSGDWVEACDSSLSAIDTPRRLFEVTNVDPSRARVWLDAKDQEPFPGEFDKAKCPFLRRWDHKAGQPSRGGLTLRNGAAVIEEGKWLSLEDGIEILFEKGRYRTGDYWLIPARTTEGIVQWPQGAQGPESRLPHGIEHHYAPLAVITAPKGSREAINLRVMFKRPLEF